MKGSVMNQDLKLLDELGHSYNYAVVSTWYCGNRYIDCLSVHEEPSRACVKIKDLTDAKLYQQTFQGWEPLK
jgi:hypothetical protein